MRLLGLIIILFFLQTNLYANEFWKKDYSKVDSLALTITATSNVDKLAFDLTNIYSTDLEKYRAIFTWIASNIEYDCEALKKKSARVTDPEKIIKNKKAVCAGYSSLYSKLCELAKLECFTIYGWSKDRQDIGKQLSDKPNHAWNAIKIEGQWYLCDVTWGAGSTSEETGIFSFSFDDYYFCTPPKIFSYNHLPEKKRWLLGAKQTRNKFMQSPHYYPESIQLNTLDLKPSNGIIHYEKDKVVKFSFVIEGVINNISVSTPKAKYSTNIKFEIKNGKVEFDYVMNTFANYLFIYINYKGFVAYKIK